MEDIFSKVQEILDDPKKMEGFKNLASVLMSNQAKDDNNKQVQDIKIDKSKVSNLSNKNVKEKNLSDIENTLKNFIGSQGSKQNNNLNIDNQNQNFINPELILKLNKAMLALNQDDKNINFLKSLRVLLSNERQKKVDEAIKIIRIINLIPLVKELNLLKDFKII